MIKRIALSGAVKHNSQGCNVYMVIGTVWIGDGSLYLTYTLPPKHLLFTEAG